MYAIELLHLKQEIRNSKKELEKILSDDFIEFQSSGGIINKPEVLIATDIKENV